MLSSRDKTLVLRMIKTGDYSIVLQLNYDLNKFEQSKITFDLHKTLKSRSNYALAKKLTQIIYSGKNKLSTNLINLFTFELNYYDDNFQRNKAYEKLNVFLTKLLGFDTKKRIHKLLIQYCRASKALQELVKSDSDDLSLLTTIKNIILETKRVFP